MSKQETKEEKIKAAQEAHNKAKNSHNPDDYITAAKLLEECGFYTAAGVCYMAAGKLRLQEGQL